MTRSSIKEEQQLLEEIYAAGQCRPAAKRSGVRRVGIFFVVQGKPFIDSTPVTEAESYEHFKIHGLDHYQYWEQLQQIKAVPSDVEYDEVPRVGSSMTSVPASTPCSWIAASSRTRSRCLASWRR